MTEEEAFESWWVYYPRKMAKGVARKSWRATEKIRPPIEKMIRALVVAKASEQWQQDGGKFIPYPSTYLNQERWEDSHITEISRVRDGKAWHESVGGIERRALELKMEWNAREETFQQFARRVKVASDSDNVVPILGAA